MELAHELVPAATIFGLLVNPTDPLADFEVKGAQAAALTLGLQLHVLRASTEPNLMAPFHSRPSNAGRCVCDSHLCALQWTYEQMAALSIRHSLPTIYEYRQL